MILTYTKPSFKEDILNRIKLHTLRLDPNERWKPSISIQHWMGNPRNVRAKVKPHQFGTDECKSTQVVVICHNLEFGRKVYILGDRYSDQVIPKELSESEIELLAKTDGFKDVNEFFEWFNEDCFLKLIHWTDLRY